MDNEFVRNKQLDGEMKKVLHNIFDKYTLILFSDKDIHKIYCKDKEYFKNLLGVKNPYSLGSHQFMTELYEIYRYERGE